MLDLKQFCSTDPERKYLHSPFTRGKFTYATNGHIAIRISKRAGDSIGKVSIEKFFKEPAPETSPITFAPLPDLPSSSIIDCGICYGSGLSHDCPNCDCECPNCGGTGNIEKSEIVKVRLRGSAFALKYIRMLAALPGLQLENSPIKDGAMYFRFAGGDGVLMPMTFAENEGIEGEQP